jgi:hypothetical protein
MISPVPKLFPYKLLLFWLYTNIDFSYKFLLFENTDGIVSLLPCFSSSISSFNSSSPSSVPVLQLIYYSNYSGDVIVFIGEFSVPCV